MVRLHSDVPEMSLRYGLGFWLDDATDAVMLVDDAGVGFVSARHRGARFTSWKKHTTFPSSA